MPALNGSGKSVLKASRRVRWREIACAWWVSILLVVITCHAGNNIAKRRVGVGWVLMKLLLWQMLGCGILCCFKRHQGSIFLS